MVLGRLSGLFSRAGQGAGLGSANVEGGIGTPAGFRGNAGRKELVRADFFTSTVTLSANNDSNFEQLGAKTVAAQQALRFGFGLPNTNNQGQVYASLIGSDASNTQREGFIRLVWKDANAFNTHVIKELRTENIRGSTTDRENQILMPEQPIRGLEGRDFASEDEKLAIDYRGDNASDTFSVTTGTILITSTQYFR